MSVCLFICVFLFQIAISAIFEKKHQLASEEVTLELVKKQMYVLFVVWTGMLCFAKKCLEIVRLCCHTIFNEIIQDCQ